MVLIAGCADLATSVGDEAPQTAPPIASLSGTCTQGQFSQFNARQWPCDSVIEFYSSSGPLAADMAVAVGAWQARLTATGFGGLPFFTTTSVPGDAEASVTGTTSGSTFCGRWIENTKQLQVLSASQCETESFDNMGPLSNLLLHEVGHAVGWIGSLTDKEIFSTSAADHCVMNLPDDGSINGTICSHEAEGILAGYGLTTYNSQTFFSTPFVISSAATLSPVTLTVGDTHVFTPGDWQLERGGGVGGTGTSYTWTSTDPDVATVVGGTVTAIDSGTTTIRALPAQSGSYLFAHPFRTAGVTAMVTVDPLDPINLAITGIFSSAADSLPIYDPGTYSLLALIGPGDTTGVTYKWIIKYSHIPNDSIMSHTSALPPWGPRASSFGIADPIGSYTVTVRAIPGRVTIVGADTTRTVGSAAVREFTVCPRPGGGGSQHLSAEVPTGEGTNAVFGCT